MDQMYRRCVLHWKHVDLVIFACRIGTLRASKQYGDVLVTAPLLEAQSYRERGWRAFDILCPCVKRQCYMSNCPLQHRT